MPSFAQAPYACITKDAELVWANYDDQGKIADYTRNTIRDISQYGESYEVTIFSEKLDNPKQKSGEDGSLRKMNIKDGMVDVEVFGTEGASVAILNNSGIGIPNKLAVGYKLPIGDMAISMGGMQCVCNITDNDVIRREEVKTEAGTFKCYVVRQVSVISLLGAGLVATTTTWYSRGVGIVKSETLVGNEIAGSCQLISFNK